MNKPPETAPQERDAAFQRWLREEVVATYDA
jgi:hypothetical protein